MTNRRLQCNESTVTVAHQDRLLGKIELLDRRRNAVGHCLQASFDEVRIAEARQFQGNHLVLFGQWANHTIPTAAIGQQRVEQHERSPGAADRHADAAVTGSDDL
jgi:hypothetical protein